MWTFKIESHCAIKSISNSTHKISQTMLLDVSFLRHLVFLNNRCSWNLLPIIDRRQIGVFCTCSRNIIRTVCSVVVHQTLSIIRFFHIVVARRIHANGSKEMRSLERKMFCLPKKSAVRQRCFCLSLSDFDDFSQFLFAIICCLQQFFRRFSTERVT